MHVHHNKLFDSSSSVQVLGTYVRRFASVYVVLQIRIIFTPPLPPSHRLRVLTDDGSDVNIVIS